MVFFLLCFPVPDEVFHMKSYCLIQPIHFSSSFLSLLSSLLALSFSFIFSLLLLYSFAFLDGPPDWKSNVRWLLWFALLVTAVHFLLYASFITTESMLYYCKTIIPPACVHTLLLMIIYTSLSLSLSLEHVPTKHTPLVHKGVNLYERLIA